MKCVSEFASSMIPSPFVPVFPRLVGLGEVGLTFRWGSFSFFFRAGEGGKINSISVFFQLLCGTFLNPRSSKKTKMFVWQIRPGGSETPKNLSLDWPFERILGGMTPLYFCEAAD